MQTNQTLPSIQDLKNQARRLKDGLTERRHDASYSGVLELVAKQYGYKDWNTLHAAAGRGSIEGGPDSCPFQVGQAVTGRYLDRTFKAVILSVQTRAKPGLFKVTFDLCEPVDVARSERFSALRKRITLTIGSNGRTLEKTSDGKPHMILDGYPR